MTIPKWLHGKTIAVFDLETDRIPTTVIYMAGVAVITIDDNGSASRSPSKVFTHIWTPYSQGSLLEAMALIGSCDLVGGHNSVGFDNPECLKHLGIDLTSKPHLDTMILGKIIFSKDDLFAIDAQLNIDKDLWASYSLKAFGQRMGDAKIEFEDFDEMSETMAIYCNQDTNLTARLLLFLLAKETFPLEPVVTIEHQAAAIIAEQTAYGFYLDIERARELNTTLLKEKGEIARELAEVFKPKWLKSGPVKTYKKQSIVKKYLPNNSYIKLLGTN